VPQQLHLDLSVSSVEELVAQHARALSLGACLLHDRFDHPIEPLYVYAGPAGHHSASLLRRSNRWVCLS
jgi:hypothetical protein